MVRRVIYKAFIHIVDTATYSVDTIAFPTVHVDDGDGTALLTARSYWANNSIALMDSSVNAMVHYLVSKSTFFVSATLTAR